MKQTAWGLTVGMMMVLFLGCASQPMKKQFMQKIEKTIVITTRYLVYLPENYAQEQNVEWPLLIFLHGAGERGNDIEQVKTQGIPKLIEAGREFPCIVVSPQCSEGAWWDIEILMDMLRTLQRDYRIDSDRMYLTGLSMGGFAAWAWADAYPELFAAIAPVCGGGNPETAYRLKTISVWAFHGAKDTAVPLEKSQAMVEALQRCQGDVNFTVYPDVGHASWEPAYGDEALYTWLWEKKRKPIEVPAAKKHQPVYAVHVPQGMKLDGQLSEWDNATALAIATDDCSQLMRRVKLKWTSGKDRLSSYRGPEDCSARIKMMWDESGLYLAAEVKDDIIVCDRINDPIWIGDCIDLGLSFREASDTTRPYLLPDDPNKPGQEYFTAKDFIFGFTPDGPNHTPEYHVYRNPIKQNKKADEEIQVASQRTPGGYTLEAFISAKYLGCEDKLKSGSQIGFNCGVYDLDQKAKAEDFAVSEWPSSGGDPWSPDAFGKLELK